MAIELTATEGGPSPQAEIDRLRAEVELLELKLEKFKLMQQINNSHLRSNANSEDLFPEGLDGIPADVQRLAKKKRENPAMGIDALSRLISPDNYRSLSGRYHKLARAGKINKPKTT